nr:hypothetical protein [Verrucomicrobiota bacterium]
MPPEGKRELPLEIGHVLFLDIVGYSKLLINEQSERIQKLKEIVRATEQVRLAEASGKLLRLPTGDGVALVFRTSPEAPVLCALEISKALKSHPELPVRMGVHSGPVNEIADFNEQANIAGAGINIAQRVMDCGDAGHILISKHVADDIDDYPQWRPYLHPLGECEVKHGVRISVVNLYGDSVGNPQLPKKLQALKKHQARKRGLGLAAGVIVLLAAIAGVALFSRHRAQPVAAIADKSIAVLPFENRSSDKDQEYFSDGISDELLNLLAKIPELRVTARTSSFAFRGKNLPIPEVARKLHVAHILDGSVQKAGNVVRITAQLVDAGSDTQRWSQTWDRKLDDIFEIQDEIAGEVMKELKIKLLGAAPKVRTTDPKAYALYLQARELGQRLTAETFAKSDALYREALAIDPRYARAWDGLAANFAAETSFGMLSNQEGYTRARAASEKALAIDPDDASAYASLGW